MNSKIFIKVFFEKSKYMIMYSLSIVTFWYVMFFQIPSDTYVAHYQKKIPDIELCGQTADFDHSFMLYKEIDASIQDKLTDEGIKFYGLTARNLYTFSDAYYQVSYRVYGAEEEFLHELSDYLRRGKLPEPGKTEAVIGSNVAEFYDVMVGDVLKLPITLEETADTAKEEYVVSGILMADASFFSDNIYISSQTVEALGYTPEKNTFYIYGGTKKACQRILSELHPEQEESVGTALRYYETKISLLKTIGASLFKTLLLSGVVLSVLFVSLMKDTARKIGLMKALGISDRDIIKLFIKGFGVYNLIGMAISYFSLGLIRLAIGIPFPASVMLYTLNSYIIIFLVTIIILFVLCKKISPKLAMYQY